MDTVILGGGLSGLSLASLLEKETLVLEKETRTGGLCRSFDVRGVKCDIGPHIIFSKNAAALEILNSLAPANRLRRSNKIWHGGRLVKYPFENELFALPENEKQYCLQSFLNNPYRAYKPQNMLQFYLHVFGEGITRLYLQPYNEKIWKFDPAFMDMQMVERIPCPPDEDIIKSAAGTATEGYTHQLYFTYPLSGGINALVDGMQARGAGKSKVSCSAQVQRLERTKTGWKIETSQGSMEASRVINCMPLHELAQCIAMPAEVQQAVSELKYNSIYIAVVHVAKDAAGDNFALNFADKKIAFHRLSKPGFLGPNYLPDSGALLMAEITFREGTEAASWTQEQVVAAVSEGLVACGIAAAKDIKSVEVRRFKYAYVIYDLNHRKNADTVLAWLRGQGIESCGRFAEFEYINMDAAVARAVALAGKINSEKM